MAGEFDLMRVMRAIAELPFELVKPESPDAMTPAVDARRRMVLRPYPQQGVTLDEIAVDSFGAGYGKKTVRCSVGYALFVEPVAAGRNNVEMWSNLMAGISDVVNTFAANDTVDGAEHITVSQATQSGPVLDMADNAWHGAVFQIQFMVFFN